MMPRQGQSPWPSSRNVPADERQSLARALQFAVVMAEANASPAHASREAPAAYEHARDAVDHDDR